MAFDLAAFHEAAVGTPSHESVDAMRDLLVETLADAGHEATVERGTVRATRGAGDLHVVLNTHLDTVPPHVAPEVLDAPPGFAAAGIDAPPGDVLAGRGACDAKGPLAAMVASFLRADPSGRVTLAVSHDEETTQTGGAHLADALDPDAVVVGEPTGLDVCTAARGQFEGEVHIRGESAHAASGKGANAVRAAAPVLQAMESYDETRGPGAHETLGRPSLTPAMIEGGEVPNQVPAECTITFDRRSVPPETSDAFLADFAAHLREWLPGAFSLSVDLVRPDTPFPEAFATETDAAVVGALRAAGAGEARPFGAATEASYFAGEAPTVVFGPGALADEAGAVAHSDREYVRREGVEHAAEMLETALASL
ncbi:MAG: M20 family metallopeptidase [Haloarculaceae archaeon]